MVHAGRLSVLVCVALAPRTVVTGWTYGMVYRRGRREDAACRQSVLGSSHLIAWSADD